MPAPGSDRNRLTRIAHRDLAISRIQRFPYRASDLPVGWRQAYVRIPRDDSALAATLPRQPGQGRRRRLEQGFHQHLVRGADDRRVEPVERLIVERARLEPARDARSKDEG